MKTLYVTDLDGTLLNTGHRINEYSIRTINQLVEEGMLFTYATARSVVSASVVAKGLSTKIPVITYNGAFIVKPENGEILSSIVFTEEEIADVRSFLEACDLWPLVYSYVENVEKVSWLTERENDGIQRYLNLRQGDPRMRPLTKDPDALYAGMVFYFTCIGEKEQLLPVYERFKEDPRYTCSLHQELYRPEYWCEILPKLATKAGAVRKLKELWGCDRVISFGDEINDIPMFEVSDECYAVANAVEELKEKATGVIASNDEDGVARWLKENVCI